MQMRFAMVNINNRFHTGSSTAISSREIYNVSELQSQSTFF